MRLILVPQYPAKLRYQEWWYSEFPKQYKKYFETIIVLGESIVNNEQAIEGNFSPIDCSISFELSQIKEYMALELQKNDILFLCDLSFPGIFSSVLFHTRPKTCFAVCHATSKNKYDYFCKDRQTKWKNEQSYAGLFNTVFVATEYHQNKLGWKNTMVTPLPFPVFQTYEEQKSKKLISVSRSGVQKRNKKLEKIVEKEFGKIEFPNSCTTWEEYFHFISTSEKMLITSKEETFGYQVIDAVLNGCIPIAPRICSYPELLPDDYLYSSESECLDKIHKKLEVPQLLISNKSKQFFEITAKHMKEK